MIYTTKVSSPVGELTLAGKDNKLIGLWMEGQKYFGGSISEAMTEKDDLAIFDQTKEWLERYFARQKPAVAELSLAPAGSEFRREVWRILCEIPYGEVVTYSDIARKLAVKMDRNTMSSQAVGGAIGHNPISIIIPCHRVVGANGSLTGYAGGVETKLQLLELEGADTSKLRMPK